MSVPVLFKACDSLRMQGMFLQKLPFSPPESPFSNGWRLGNLQNVATKGREIEEERRKGKGKGREEKLLHKSQGRIRA